MNVKVRNSAEYMINIKALKVVCDEVSQEKQLQNL